MTDRMILTADLHVTDALVMGRPRLPVCLNVLEQIYEHAKANKAKAVGILGDLLDNKYRLSLNVLLALRSFFESHRDVKWIWLRGNHETINRSDPEKSVLPLFADVCVVVNRPDILTFNGATLVWMPWYPFPQYLDLLKYMVTPTDKPAILLSHIGLKEGTVGESSAHVQGVEVGVGDVFAAAPWHSVYLGDYHKAQQVNARCMYLGAPMGHEFGEANGCCWLLDEKLSITPLRIQAPAFKKWDLVKEGQNGSSGLVLPGYSAEDYNRIQAPVALLEDARMAFPGADVVEVPDEQPTATPNRLDDRGGILATMREWLKIRGLEDEAWRLMPIGEEIVRSVRGSVEG